MEQLNLTVELSSKSRVIASSGPFQIELMNQVGLEDHPQLIEISHVHCLCCGDTRCALQFVACELRSLQQFVRFDACVVLALPLHAPMLQP